MFKIHEKTGRNVILYYSAWLSDDNFAVDIKDSDKNIFMSLIDDLDVNKGLDLILHTPGGSVSATESLIDYLHLVFGEDIRAIIPQLAMSGGTMIACSCKELIMGKQSSLGPIDPQFNGTLAQPIVEEFETAKRDISQDPALAELWRPILESYPPSFVIDCIKAIEWSEDILKKSLEYSMFKNDDTDKIDNIINILGLHDKTKAHDKHLSPGDCIDMGLNVKYVEEDEELRDLILSTHYSCIDFFNKNLGAVKIFTNNNGEFFKQKVE